MTTLRAVCRECLDAYRVEGQLRCADCHHRWLATRFSHNEQHPTEGDSA